MDNTVIVLLVGGVLILLWGLSSLYTSEVYWGRLFKYGGRIIVTRGRIPARMHGVPLVAAGALGLVTAVLEMFGADSDVVETLMAVYAILILVGVIGSVLASGLGFGDEKRDPVALEQAMRRQHGDKYGRW